MTDGVRVCPRVTLMVSLVSEFYMRIATMSLALGQERSHRAILAGSSHKLQPEPLPGKRVCDDPSSHRWDFHIWVTTGLGRYLFDLCIVAINFTTLLQEINENTKMIG